MFIFGVSWRERERERETLTDICTQSEEEVEKPGWLARALHVLSICSTPCLPRRRFGLRSRRERRAICQFAVISFLFSLSLSRPSLCRLWVVGGSRPPRSSLSNALQIFASLLLASMSCPGTGHVDSKIALSSVQKAFHSSQILILLLLKLCSFMPACN